MAQAPRKTRVAMEWLKTTAGQGQSLLMQARHLVQLQQDIDAWGGRQRLKLMVGLLKEGKLKVFTDHPAMLARTRQQLPSLLSELNERGWNLNAIELKLKSFQEAAAPTARPKQGKFSETARKEWLSLQESLHDEQIKAATQRLCDHNGWNKNEA
jgi:hypothetical protein